MAETIKSYEDLEVWQGGIELCVHIYELVQRLPSSERFELSSQMRRSAVSVPSNVAEGHARRLPKPFLNHVHIALGSLAELETCLVIALRLKFITEEQFHKNHERLRASDRCCTVSPARLNAVWSR